MAARLVKEFTTRRNLPLHTLNASPNESCGGRSRRLIQDCRDNSFAANMDVEVDFLPELDLNWTILVTAKEDPKEKQVQKNCIPMLTELAGTTECVVVVVFDLFSGQKYDSFQCHVDVAFRFSNSSKSAPFDGNDRAKFFALVNGTDGTNTCPPFGYLCAKKSLIS
ncbi:hypothetical protein RUM44_008646 [Polyplax serrata]|uniref:Uncharacterized protein n=1 Tax=Polyplax serrata TaxID=468196 RepID=A0ABR1B943_POLSC